LTEPCGALPRKCLFVEVPIKEEGVPITVTTLEGFKCDWVLRKELEWEDFQLLVDARIQDRKWAAIMENERWKDQFRKPMTDQKIHLTEHLNLKEESRWEERQWKEIEAWERYVKVQRRWEDDEEKFYEGLKQFDENVETENQVAIMVHFPDHDQAITLVLPKKATRAHFRTFMNHQLKENEWSAGFRGEVWYNHERTPGGGEEVDVCWVFPDMHIQKQKK
jgi:hypothetical protein